MKNIISVKEFKEYTAIQYIDEVKRCNSVCHECGIHISDFTKKGIEGAITAREGICDLCGKEKYISSIRHY